MTAERFRQMALALPEAKESAHREHPDFRVNGKIFATLWPNQSTAVVKLPLADQSALVQMDPDAFSLNAWSYQGATTVHLKHVALMQFRKVVQAAWRNVAPKRLVASVGDES